MATTTTTAASGQGWDAAGYARHARFVADLGGAVVDLLAPRPGERILDLGCGDGALTARLAAAGVQVVGLDASAPLLRAARARGLTVVEGDGHALPFAGAFDAVFSNAALHWMGCPAEVAAGVARALRPGGRFVGEFGGFGNVAAIVTALGAVLGRRGLDAGARHPWYFPRPEAYAAVLESAGLRVREIALHPRPTRLPTGMAGWLATFAGPFLVGLADWERAAVLAEAEILLAPTLRDDAGGWWADYVRLRFAADLPG